MDLTDFNTLIERLCSPDAFGHPASEVKVIETHISAVLLAGEFAYKIKKPVDFGFVDFSTLDKRRYFCGEELRLNSRFAPELYLSVVAVRGSLDSPSLREGPGPAIEYAVKMRRFDQESLLDRCIGRTALITGQMIEAFAADVAEVHRGAERASPKMGYGTPGVIASSVRECRLPIQSARIPFAEGRSRELFEYMENEAHILQPWFDQRLHRGHVRECHGDLHLGNLFLSGGRIRAFDCIEFNPDLRWIDVANDVAFCTMDLLFHGKAAFARRFTSAYLDSTGDYSALRVLRFYEVYRALVRAEVASLREREAPGSGAGDAVRYLSLAESLMRETHVTPLIITHGVSGSGKSFVSAALLAASEAIRVRSDAQRNRLLPRNENRYTEPRIDYIYGCLWDAAREIIAAGYPAIVDATFLKRAHRDRFRRLAEDLGVPFRILHCTAPKDELRRRITKRSRRGSDASEAGLGVLDLQLKDQEPLADDELSSVVRCDSRACESVSQLARGLRLDLDRGPPGAGSE